MSSKKKLIISLVVGICILLLSTVVIVTVSSAFNQQISSNIKVTYKHSPNVVGWVRAEYKYGNIKHYMTTDGNVNTDHNDKVCFEHKEPIKTKSLRMQKTDLKNGVLKLEEGVSEIILSFHFVNTGINNYIASLSMDNIEKQENFTVSFSLDGEKTWSRELPIVEVPAYSWTPGSKIVYLKLSIENSAFNANFEGNFFWDLEAEEIFS